MEKPSENSVSRGEQRLEITENFENAIVEISKTETPIEPTYSAENSELDSILGESTTTKADKNQAGKTEQAEVKQRSNQMISTKKASGLALKGLQEFCNGISGYTGKELSFGENFVKIFVAATTPVIQKYSRHVDLDPENINLDSWMPEILAISSVTALGGSTYYQCKKLPVTLSKEKQGGKSGDKS